MYLNHYLTMIYVKSIKWLFKYSIYWKLTHNNLQVKIVIEIERAIL